jgi:DNA-binding CsgD family transcriptional regulator
VFNVLWAIPRVNKEEVLLLKSQGMSRNAIAEKLGRARKTISKVLNSVEN